MSAKKVVTLVVCMVLVAALSVAGTLAYLTSTDEVVNSFTYGKIAITMDETDVDEYGVKDGETRVKANTYRLIPGREYTKDPIIHVVADSESSWLFVKVENGIADIETKVVGKTIHEQILDNDWTELTAGSGIYYQKWEKVDDPETATNDDLDVPVFATFEIDGASVINGEDGNIDDYDGEVIKVTAYAIQADGFDTADEAWAASDWDN